MLTRSVRTIGKRLLYDAFVTMQRVGINLLPLHFYSPIPDIRDLRSRADWMLPRSMHGIASLSIGEQLAWLSELLAALPHQTREAGIHRAAISANGTDGYGEIEAEALAAFIASCRPPKIVQIGCGVSTAVILAAARSAGYAPRVTCIEPYPSRYLRQEAGAGAINLLASPAQSIDLGVITDLGARDLLFIDSTHTVKPGSEVNRIILEVLPRLRPGAFVHFHDIYFPFDYSRGLLAGDLFFPSECVLLYAFLLQNPSYRIELCLSILHYEAALQLKMLIPRYDSQMNRAGLRAPGGTHFPSSLYLRCV